MALAQQQQTQPVTPDTNPTNKTVTTDPTRNATTNPTQNPGVQTQTTNPAENPTATPGIVGETTRIEGCITGPVNGNYMLVANGKQYRLTGDYENIRQHLGQRVAITGNTKVEPSNPAVSESGPGSAAMPGSSNTTGATGTSTTTGPAQQSNSNNLPSLNVTRVEMLQGHCDTATGGPPSGPSASSSGPNPISGSSTAPVGVTTEAGAGNTAPQTQIPQTQIPQTQVPPATATKGESSTTPVMEQQNPAQAGAPGQEASSSGAQVITGCLRKSPTGAADTYLLKTSGGGQQWTEVVPNQQTRPELADHVDQQVKLTGDWGTATQSAQALPESDQPSSSRGSATGGNSKQFQVSRIDVISTSCSNTTNQEREY
jgi:hypothetical protein